MKAEESVGVSAKERSAALIILGAATLLRVPYVFHYRFNSDEPQHLHVVWAWTRGLLPYRDVFDNHPPLFHVLMAPLLALVGERADAAVLMRFAMVPLALLAVWLTWVIASNLYGRRVALWSAVLLGAHYEFFFKSLEFRTDNLWTVGWLATLAVITGGPLTSGRALAAGAVLGVAFCTSQKTFLMLVALAGAAALTAVLPAGPARPARWLRAGRHAAAAAAGMVAAPAAVWAFFAAHGAQRELVYGVLTHNALAGLGEWREPWRLLILPAGLAVAAWLAVPRLRAASGDRVGVLRVFLVLATAIYALALESVWPLITGQDLLPLFPLAAVLAVAAVDRWDARLRRLAPGGATSLRAPAWVLLGVLAAEFGVLVFKGPIWRDRASAQTALVGAALGLTDRDEPVMDAKGETVFRRRAFFWVLETITIERLRRGLIADTIARDVVASRCFVAAVDSPRFPSLGRAFLNENFVAVGPLRVAGKLLRVGSGAPARAEFDVAIPGPYAVVTPTGSATGTLDGTPYSGARALAAGRHRFVPDGAPVGLAVIWARAAERGWTPFARSRDVS